MGPIGGPGVGGRIHETVSHTCLSSSAEYELALILKELRVITDVVSSTPTIFLPTHTKLLQQNKYDNFVLSSFICLLFYS